METSRLLALIDILERDASTGYDSALTALLQVYVRARDNPTADISGQLRSAISAFYKRLDASVVNVLPPSKLHLATKIGALQYFGSNVKGKVDEIISSSNGSLPATVKQLEEFKAQLTKFRKILNHTRTGLI